MLLDFWRLILCLTCIKRVATISPTSVVIFSLICWVTTSMQPWEWTFMFAWTTEIYIFQKNKNPKDKLDVDQCWECPGHNQPHRTHSRSPAQRSCNRNIKAQTGLGGDLCLTWTWSRWCWSNRDMTWCHNMITATLKHKILNQFRKLTDDMYYICTREKRCIRI